jgi:hypothetical protein
MALVVKDRVKQFSTTSGTGTLTLGATPSGFQAFSVVGDGNTTYYAIVDPNTGDWEVGLGTYTLAGTALSRDTVLESSNGGSLVNFSADTKDVFCTYPAETAVFETPAGIINKSEFPSGTKMMFVQTSAPTGWTKDTTHNDKALRVVSGTAGSGGSVAFTTAFASQNVAGTVSVSASTGPVAAPVTVGDTTLSTPQIPSHTHIPVLTGRNAPNTPGAFQFTRLTGSNTAFPTRNAQAETTATGGGGAHSHPGTGGAHSHPVSAPATFTGTSINLAVQYVDVIIATKD